MSKQDQEEIKAFIFDAVMSAQKKGFEGASLTRVERKLDNFITEVKAGYVEQKEFELRMKYVERIVFGFVGFVLIAVFSTLLISIGLNP